MSRSRFRSYSISEGVLDEDFQERLKRLSNEHREMTSLRECIEDEPTTNSSITDNISADSEVLNTYIKNRFSPSPAAMVSPTSSRLSSSATSKSMYNTGMNDTEKKQKQDELMASFNNRFSSTFTTNDNDKERNIPDSEPASPSDQRSVSPSESTDTAKKSPSKTESPFNSRFSSRSVSPNNSRQLATPPKRLLNTAIDTEHSNSSYYNTDHSKSYSNDSNQLMSQTMSNSRQLSAQPVKFSAVGAVPTKVEFHDIMKAASRIKSGVKKTPCDQSVRLSDLLGMDVFLKREYMQITGSFKERGARNTLLLLSEEEKKRGVITASAGNHGLALAYHGNALSIPVTVFMPVNAPIMKVKQCKYYNADVHLIGSDIIQAKSHAMVLGDEKGLSYVNGYDHPYILAGQGTCGIEIGEQVNDIDAVVIPIGGAGLLAGCAVALKHMNPQIQIIGVESDQSASFKAAMEAGDPVRIDVDQSMTLADGLCVSKVGENAFYNAAPHVDRLVQVDEAYIAVAVLRLIENEKCVVEGAGATGLAAAFAGLLPELRGKRVVFPLCGGNIDSTVLGRVIDRGLAADGRLIRFTVVVSDRPGGLSGLINYLADKGAGIKDVFHERAWLKTSIHTVRNKVIIEVRDYQHGEEIRHGLEEVYSKNNLVWGSEAIQDLKK